VPSGPAYRQCQPLANWRAMCSLTRQGATCSLTRLRAWTMDCIRNAHLDLLRGRTGFPLPPSHNFSTPALLAAALSAATLSAAAFQLNRFEGLGCEGLIVDFDLDCFFDS